MVNGNFTQNGFACADWVVILGYVANAFVWKFLTLCCAGTPEELSKR